MDKRKVEGLVILLLATAGHIGNFVQHESIRPKLNAAKVAIATAKTEGVRRQTQLNYDFYNGRMDQTGYRALIPLMVAWGGAALYHSGEKKERDS